MAQPTEGPAYRVSKQAMLNMTLQQLFNHRAAVEAELNALKAAGACAPCTDGKYRRRLVMVTGIINQKAG